MPGLGTIINAVGILLGGICGMLFGKKMKQRYQDTLMRATGVCILFIGIGGAMEKMLTLGADGLVSSGSMILIVSVALGSIIGEIINIEYGMQRFGEWLKRISKSEGDLSFVDAFVTASLTVCIGAMAIVGAIRDGIYGDPSILAAKAMIDFIIILIMTASKGKGCMFSAIPVFIFQEAITLLSAFIEPIMTDAALNNLSLVGSVLIFCVGLTLIWDKKIKVANLLPSVVLAVVCAYIPLF